MRSQRDKGIALITALLVLFLISAIVVGMIWMVSADSSMTGNSSQREEAFYGAEAGMEELTAQMGNTFATSGAVTGANISSFTSAPPVLPGIQFVNGAGASTYQVGCTLPPPAAEQLPCTSPTSVNATVKPPSPYAGMQALITSFKLHVAAQTETGSEVKLVREVQTVAIPVFQFGIFSQTDLSFFNGPPFNFGGRVHTNGNLWLAANSGPLYLNNIVTAVGQVIRTNLENGTAVNSGSYGGTVDIATAPGTTDWRALGLNEGSVTGNSVVADVSTTANNPTWSGTVEPAYNGDLLNNVPALTLTSTALAGLNTPISLIRRAVPGEQTSAPATLAEQYFTEASLRIMLDDYPTGVTQGQANNASCANADMLQLPTVTATVPVDLALLTTQPSWWSGAATFYPLPTSPTSTYSATTGYWVQSGKPLITGCIKIEYQDNAGNWHDVTTEILSLGFAGRNMNPQSTHIVPPTLPSLPGSEVNASTCSDPNPNAVIRLARVRDNPSSWVSGNQCGNATTASTDYWPMALYDTRESIYRDVALSGNVLTAQGVMDYIELDVTDLAKWFTGAIGVSGTNANNQTGYTVYFSDRRGNILDPVDNEKTGSLGFNDIVNPSDTTNGCPNGVLDQGEDFEGDGTLRTYGKTEMVNQYTITSLLSGGNLTTTVLASRCGSNTWPGATYVNAQDSRVNSTPFFRRALKLVNGSTISLGTGCFAGGAPPCGLTVAAENPIYVFGDYNAPGGNFSSTTPPSNPAAAIVADSVTLLSDSWNDVNSFASPYNTGSRNATTTAYRAAIIAGKGIPFPIASISNSGADFGTDGGTHNFLRYIENWGSATLNYEGSLVSFYYSRQGIGPYKCCNTVYSPPNRVYFFDGNFTQGTQYLPPRTPVLRNINTIGFQQDYMPTQ